jgi:Subtilase family
MVHDRASWRMKLQRAGLALAVAALPVATLDSPAVRAQAFMRSPSISVGSRIPAITPRIDPNIAGGGIGIDRVSPNLRTHQACGYAYRNSDGNCSSQLVASVNGGGGGGGPSGKKANNNGPLRNVPPSAINTRSVANELVAEIDGSLSDAQADALARRHGLARIGSQNFPLVGGTIGLFRVTDRRSVETVSREFATDGVVRSVQPNFRYVLQEQKAASTEGDPAQYALAKLRLPEAHTLAHGANVTIAVIDSGIDAKHPELANSIADSFDALGSKEGPHAHGTGVAGAIVAHARLMGAAPAARILAIRAFGTAQNGQNGQSGSESTTFVVLKSLDYAVAHGAQIINMSFAGPKDALIERGIAAAAAKGIVTVAASGNAGAKSPPLYPAAYASVIAVSATDAQDRLIAASNRGSYIAVAAPGADIFLPAPDEKYQMTSGTSFSAAYISGLAALVLERNPAQKPEEVRAVLTKTARDLGAPGRDDLFGAGEADAFAAVSAVIAAPATPMATVSEPAAAAKVLGPDDVTRALKVPSAIMASETVAPDKPVAGEVGRPAGQ